MLKGIALIAVVVVVVLALLILLQPSSQESALSALAAAEGVLEQVNDTPVKLDAARKSVLELPLPPKNASARSAAVAAINEADALLEADRAKLKATKAEMKLAISRVRSNLSSLTATERARGVRDQILALIWPLAVVSLIIYLVSSKAGERFVQTMASMVSTIKVPGGAEIAFASAVVKRKQEDVLQSYREQAIAQYDAAAAQNQIAETVDRIVKERIKPYLAQKSLGSSLRCTVHVRDILFDNSLYQLIDYVPRSRDTKRRRGRAWSVRYGMMGRSWRLENTDFAGSVPKDEKQLIKEWGMTKKEAEEASGRQTVFCHVIKAQNRSPLAILYLDAESDHAFGDHVQMTELDGVVDQAITEYGLQESLEKVWEQVHSLAPLIEIHGSRE